MIPSKINKSGFTFIEMMIALTMLATFGSSLFLVQSNMLAKVFTTGKLVLYSDDTVGPQQKFIQKVQQTILQKKSADAVTIEEKKENPERTVTVKTNQINEQSSLYKQFGKRVRIMKTTILHDGQTSNWFKFLYIPEAADDKAKDAPKER